ncbi:MAG: terminase small subunit [Chloroflexi bacterium]|nr:terminase small subunit [Chloroflexota bacterium]
MSTHDIDLPAHDADPELPQLSQRHQAFADGYLLHGNVTQAAIDAGYSPTGNRDSARATGFDILRKPSVAAYIATKGEKLRSHRDSALAAAYAAAPAAVARLESLAAKDMDDATDAAYGASPDRLYLVGLDGTVAYKGGPGPWFLDADEWEHAIEMYLEGQAAN